MHQGRPNGSSGGANETQRHFYRRNVHLEACAAAPFFAGFDDRAKSHDPWFSGETCAPIAQKSRLSKCFAQKALSNNADR
jgi:hypothetical protein